MDPWGLSGSAFLTLYVVLLIVPGLIGGLWYGLATKRATKRAVQRVPSPSVYHLAYLARGADRAIETAVAALIERDRIRVTSFGWLRLTDPSADHPLEHTVGALLRSRASGTTLQGVVASLRDSQAVAEIRADLERNGMIVSPSIGRTPLRFVSGAYLVVLALGIARLITSISLDQPVGAPILLLAFAALAVFLSARFLRAHNRKAVTPTEAAKEEVRLARAATGTQPDARHDGSGWGPTVTPMLAGAVGLVALGGVASYPDEEVGTALASYEGDSAASASRSPAGGGCGSVASDGGGGSCGGSGCGGCGGCGG